MDTFQYSMPGPVTQRHSDVRKVDLAGSDTHRTTSLLTITANIQQGCIQFFRQPFKAVRQLPVSVSCTSRVVLSSRRIPN